MASRTGQFRLFTTHGVVRPSKGSEARIRNDLYMVGAIKLMHSRESHTVVRLIGYEVPLQSGKLRGECIDLFGYDSEHNPYIIELKKESSTEKLQDVINQINDYALILDPLLPKIELEINDKLFLKDFELKRDIKKIILAPRDYYKSQSSLLYKNNKSDILFCYFSGIESVNDLAEKAIGEKVISISIHNK